MKSTNELVSALDAAIAMAEEKYQRSIIELATAEAAKSSPIDRELADIDDIHHARTRVIALHAARDELIKRDGEERD